LKYSSPQHVDVWLSGGYQHDQRYSLLYMHDGQMLFDESATWHRQEWGVDGTFGRPMQSESIDDCIVVGICNMGTRCHAEYFLQSPFDAPTKEQHGWIESANAQWPVGLLWYTHQLERPTTLHCPRVKAFQ